MNSDMEKQVLLILASLSVLVHVTFSCCGPEQWEGMERISGGFSDNGTPVVSTVNV